MRIIALGFKLFYTGKRLDEAGLIHHMDMPYRTYHNIDTFNNFDCDNLIFRPRSSSMPVRRDAPLQSYLVPDEMMEYRNWVQRSANSTGMAQKLVYINGAEAGAKFQLIGRMVYEYSPVYDVTTDTTTEPMGTFAARPEAPKSVTDAVPYVLGPKSGGGHPLTIEKLKQVTSAISNHLSRQPSSLQAFGKTKTSPHGSTWRDTLNTASTLYNGAKTAIRIGEEFEGAIAPFI